MRAALRKKAPERTQGILSLQERAAANGAVPRVSGVAWGSGTHWSTCEARVPPSGSLTSPVPDTMLG